MEEWYYSQEDIKLSPSFKDGIDGATEGEYRREGAKFIAEVAGKLKLRYVTAATGQVYFHRFYMLHSFKEYHRFVIGSACLFLSGKVEETPKKARDLFKAIQESETIRKHSLNLQLLFGNEPKETLLTMERILLKTIKFDLQVEHPYKYMLKYAKTFKCDKTKRDQIVQTGWAFINDSLCTTLCLQWEPEIITIALIHLSCRLTKCEISDWMNKPSGYQGKWWDQFVEDVSLDLLESICHQVLDFYANTTEKTAKPTRTEDRKRTSSTSDVPPPPPKQMRVEVAEQTAVVSSIQPVQSIYQSTAQPQYMTTSTYAQPVMVPNIYQTPNTYESYSVVADHMVSQMPPGMGPAGGPPHMPRPMQLPPNMLPPGGMPPGVPQGGFPPGYQPQFYPNQISQQMSNQPRFYSGPPISAPPSMSSQAMPYPSYPNQVPLHHQSQRRSVLLELTKSDEM